MYRTSYLVSARRDARRRAELRAIPDGLPVTIRRACPDDAEALARLADLDDARVPAGNVVVAEVGGELWAAASLDGRGAVADPFRPSGDLLAALVARRASGPRFLRRVAAAPAAAVGRSGRRGGHPAGAVRVRRPA